MKIKIALVSVLIASSCFSQQLWKGSNYGMSLSELVKAFPDATLDTSYNSAYTENAIAKNGDPTPLNCKLKIDNFELINESFNVKFLFKGETLSQVRITLNKQGLSDSELFELFKNLSDALTTKYGNAISIHHSGQQHIAAGIVKSQGNGTWNFEKTNILIEYFSLWVPTHIASDGKGGYRSWFVLTYKIGLTQEAAKL